MKKIFIFCAFFLISNFSFAANVKPAASGVSFSAPVITQGENRIVTATYTDNNGVKDIKYVYLLINSAVSGKSCFYGYYDCKNNKLYLRNDTDNAWLGGFIPQTQKVIENSYAKLNCSNTSFSASGNTLTIKWATSFKAPFFGVKQAYLYAADNSNLNSGWLQKGEIAIYIAPVYPK